MKLTLLSLRKEVHQGFFLVIQQLIVFKLYFLTIVQIVLYLVALELPLFPFIQVSWDQM